MNPISRRHRPMKRRSGPWRQTMITTLDYGETRSIATITCDVEPWGVTCTDSTTGHFLRLSRGSYELG
jgi:hypothetical protein